MGLSGPIILLELVPSLELFGHDQVTAGGRCGLLEAADDRSEGCKL